MNQRERNSPSGRMRPARPNRRPPSTPVNHRYRPQSAERLPRLPFHSSIQTLNRIPGDAVDPAIRGVVTCPGARALRALRPIRRSVSYPALGRRWPIVSPMSNVGTPVRIDPRYHDAVLFDLDGVITDTAACTRPPGGNSSTTTSAVVNRRPMRTTARSSQPTTATSSTANLATTGCTTSWPPAASRCHGVRRRTPPEDTVCGLRNANNATLPCRRRRRAV